MFYKIPNMRSTPAQASLRALSLGLLLVVIVGALFLLFQEEAVSSSGSPEAKTVVVRSGDTLWEIADRFSPESADLRIVIRELASFNGLHSKALRPGQVLRIPFDST